MDFTSGTLPQFVTVSGRGVVHNGMDAAITFWDRDIPDVEGLNVRGEPRFIQRFGDYDYVPPAGQPRPSELTLGPGESMGYSFKSENQYVSSISEVEYWYSGMGRNEHTLYYADWRIQIACGSPATATTIERQRLRNDYRPTG